MANEIITINTYEGLRENLGKELKRTAQGFVRIGYMLRYAKESNVLEGSGYSNVNEFAKAEFGIDSTMVSRFISINERFSVDGNTSQLIPQYENMGWSKLTEMLQLPDEINEEITDSFSKAEIKEIRKEIEEEQSVSPMEVLMEEKPDPEKTGYDDSWGLNLKLVYQLCKAYSNIWFKYSERYENFGEVDTTWLFEMLAPDNEAAYFVRIPGEGKFILSIKAGQYACSATNVRTMEKSSISINEINEFLYKLTRGTGLATAKAEYEAMFGTNTDTIATVEQKKEAHVMKPDVKVEEPKQEVIEGAEPSEESTEEQTEEPFMNLPVTEEPSNEDEQLPGQMEVNDYPELIPNEEKETPVEVMDAEDVEVLPVGIKDTAFLNLAKRQFEQLKRDFDMESFKAAHETVIKLEEYLRRALED